MISGKQRIRYVSFKNFYFSRLGTHNHAGNHSQGRLTLLQPTSKSVKIQRVPKSSLIAAHVPYENPFCLRVKKIVFFKGFY